VQSGESGHDVYCAPEDLSRVRDALEQRFGPSDATRLDWRPRSQVAIGEAEAEILFKLLNALDDSDDVQRVAANFEVADDVFDRLSR
jgi:transcriptional/translational regulatory protein YebC/TACO1